MFYSRRAGTGMSLRFIIGLILAVMFSTVLYANVVAPALKGEDLSLKSFMLLGAKIDELAGSSEINADSVMVHLSKDELLLFFNENVNSTLQIHGPVDSIKPDYSFYNSEKILRELSDFKDENAINIIFEKPLTCGNKSCMVLCSGFERAKPLSPSAYIAKKAPYIKNPITEFVVVRCTNVKNYKNFYNIKRFFRKPFINSWGEQNSIDMKPDEVKNSIRKILHAENYYFSGAIVFYGSDIITDIKETDNPSESKLGGWSEVAKSVGERAGILSEYQGNERTEFFQLASSYPLQIQVSREDAFLCYKPPCANIHDDDYLRFKNSIDRCLASSSTCSSLATIIELYVPNNDLSFTTGDGILYVKYKEYSYPFDNDVEMYIVMKSGENDKGDLVKEISFEQKNIPILLKRLDVVLIKAKNKQYILSHIVSDIPTDGKGKSKIKFMVDGEYKEPEI